MTKRQAKKQIKTMDKILIFLFTLMIAFIVTMIIVYILSGGVPDTLIVSVFAYMGLESGCMAAIQRKKEKLEGIADGNRNDHDSAADLQYFDHTGNGSD